MKMSGFLLGGIFGALATVYVSNNKKDVMNKASNLSQSVNGWMSKAKDKMIEVSLSPALQDQPSSTEVKSSTSQSPTAAFTPPVSAAPTAVSHGFGSLATEFGSEAVSDTAGESKNVKLKDLINKSAAVKRDVDQILKENNTSL